MVKMICKGVAVAEGGSVSTVGFGLPNVPTSPTLGEPNRLTIGVYSADNETTITAFVSYDNGVTWMAACVRDTDTPASFDVAGGAGATFEIVPAPNVQLVSSGACTLTAYAYISN
jgi:hypothetical protein